MKNKAIKLAAIVKYHRGSETLWVGTVAQLAKSFRYTLECGASWNHKIKTADEITTLKSLVNNINKSYDETQGACFDRDHVKEGNHLLTEEVKAAWAAKQDEWAVSYSTSLED